MLKNYDPTQRELLTLHCVIELLSPLSHIGEVSGNVSNLKTVKLLDFEGSPRSCFVYSGNALRNGILRRVGIAHVLQECQLKVNPDVHHTLFAGGRIDGSTANDMDLDWQIRQLMPWLSVLGTAKPVGVFGSRASQMIQGRINVGSAYLVCYESAPLVFAQFPGILPAHILSRIQELQACRITGDPFTIASQAEIDRWQRAKELHLPYLRKELRTWTEYLTIEQTTRRDSTEDPNLAKYLLPKNDAPQLQGDLFRRKKEEPKKEKSDKMIAADRLIMAGSRLYSRWDLNTTEVETGWVIDTLLQFAKSPYLGGKGNRGNGLCKLDFWFQRGDQRGHFLSVATGSQTLSEPATAAHSRYREYFEAWRQYLDEAKSNSEIRGLLNATA